MESLHSNTYVWLIYAQCYLKKIRQPHSIFVQFRKHLKSYNKHAKYSAALRTDSKRGCNFKHLKIKNSSTGQFIILHVSVEWYHGRLNVSNKMFLFQIINAFRDCQNIDKIEQKRP